VGQIGSDDLPRPSPWPHFSGVCGPGQQRPPRQPPTLPPSRMAAPTFVNIDHEVSRTINGGRSRKPATQARTGWVAGKGLGAARMIGQVFFSFFFWVVHRRRRTRFGWPQHPRTAMTRARAQCRETLRAGRRPPLVWPAPPSSSGRPGRIAWFSGVREFSGGRPESGDGEGEAARHGRVPKGGRDPARRFRENSGRIAEPTTSQSSVQERSRNGAPQIRKR